MCRMNAGFYSHTNVKCARENQNPTNKSELYRKLHSLTILSRSVNQNGLVLLLVLLFVRRISDFRLTSIVQTATTSLKEKQYSK